MFIDAVSIQFYLDFVLEKVRIITVANTRGIDVCVVKIIIFAFYKLFHLAKANFLYV